MIRMIELDDGSFIPRECCTVTNPTTSGGKSMIDDIELPCGADCGGDCTECVIQKIMDEYAVLTGQKIDLNNRHCEDCLNYVALDPGIRGGKKGFCKVRRQAETRRGRGKACKKFKEKRHEQETEKETV